MWTLWNNAKIIILYENYFHSFHSFVHNILLENCNEVDGDDDGYT